MVTGPLLILLCAAAPDLAAWLEEAAAIAPIAPMDDVAPAAHGAAGVAAQRSASAPRAVSATLPTARAPLVLRVAPVLAPPVEAPRTRALIGRSPAQPQGPPLG